MPLTSVNSSGILAPDLLPHVGAGKKPDRCSSYLRWRHAGKAGMVSHRAGAAIAGCAGNGIEYHLARHLPWRMLGIGERIPGDNRRLHCSCQMRRRTVIRYQKSGPGDQRSQSSEIKIARYPCTRRACSGTHRGQRCRI